MTIDCIRIWEACVESATLAGELASTIRAEGKMTVQKKEDGSPVTNADHAADRLITGLLTEAFPSIPLISEEGEWSAPSFHSDSHYFLIDPLDATRNYVKGRDEYTVNISLMRGNFPIIGLIYAPALKFMWSAIEGKGAYFQGKEGTPALLQVAGARLGGVRALAGNPNAMKNIDEWHLYSEGQPIVETQAVSSAIKFGLIAGGEADLYLRFGKTCAWDTSAGQLIVEEAGGRVETLSGERFSYSDPTFMNKGFSVKGW
jgi:3'(2'), 5'-bisphosphate nucleotidase